MRVRVCPTDSTRACNHVPLRPAYREHRLAACICSFMHTLSQTARAVAVIASRKSVRRRAGQGKCVGTVASAALPFATTIGCRSCQVRSRRGGGSCRTRMQSPQQTRSVSSDTRGDCEHVFPSPCTASFVGRRASVPAQAFWWASLDIVKCTRAAICRSTRQCSDHFSPKRTTIAGMLQMHGFGHTWPTTQDSCLQRVCGQLSTACVWPIACSVRSKALT